MTHVAPAAGGPQALLDRLLAAHRPGFAPRRPADPVGVARRGLGGRGLRQAHQARQRPVTFQPPPGLGKGGDIQPQGVEVARFHGRSVRAQRMGQSRR